MNIDRQKLGKVLFEEGIVTQEEIEQILSDLGKMNTYIGKVLMSCSNIKRKDIEEFLASRYEIPEFNARDFTPDKSLASLVPKDFAEKFELCPVEKLDNILVVIKSTYYNLAAIIELRKLTRLKIKVLKASEEIVNAVYKRLYEVEEIQVASETLEAISLGDDLYTTYKRLFSIDLKSTWERIHIIGETLEAVKIS